jgi:hypothetical protein
MQGRTEDLLRLGFLTQGSPGGISLREIRQEFKASQRSACAAPSCVSSPRPGRRRPR